MNLYEASIMSTLIIVLLSLILGGIAFFAFKWESLSKRVKELEGKKPKEYTMKQLPKRPTLKDIDPNNKIIFDILESAKLEDWVCEVKEEPSYSGGGNYTLTWVNPSGTINMRGRLRMTENSNTKKYEPYLGGFYVSSQDGSLSFSESDVDVQNQIIVFVWDYIVKYHENQNSEITKSYIDSINNLSSKLTTLNRNRKLNSIL